MNRFLRAFVGAMFVLASTAAYSMNIIDAVYDADTDEIVMKIAYRGTHADHRFTVAWETCRTMSDGHQEILGIIQDSDPRDPARTEFTRTERIGLRDFSCRPAKVTVGTASALYRRTLTIPGR